MTISVIIPTFNRPESLRRALRALAGSTYARSEFEVIVVDDGGSAALEGIVAEARSGMKVRLIRQRNAGPASARNTGARAAAGVLLAFTDDDCEPAREWLTAMAGTLSTAEGAMAGGPVTNALGGNVFAEASQIVSEYCLAHLNSDPKNGRFFPSNNFAVSSELYWRVGGFDPGFAICGGEDRDWCDRWLSHGLKLVRVENAVVRHSHEMGLGGFWRQQFTYGRGAWAFGSARKRRDGGRVPFEGWRFHLRMFGAPFRARVSGSRTARLTALVLVSQAAVAAGFVWQRGAGAASIGTGRGCRLLDTLEECGCAERRLTISK